MAMTITQQLPAAGSHTTGTFSLNGQKTLKEFLERQDLQTSEQETWADSPCYDIAWNPSLDAHLKRSKNLADLNQDLPTTLPSGYPKVIESARVWSGADFEDDMAYTHKLEAHDLEEISAAVTHFLARSDNPNVDEVCPETFRLPKLESKLRDLAKTIHGGAGFCVIRGLDPHAFSPLERVIAYAGITSYIGNTRACQDSGGSKIIHIKDRGRAFEGAEMRQAPYSNVAQPFHSDVCDILAMYVQETAADGGHFKIASSGKVYNEIARHRPDLIHTLSKDWIFNKFSTTTPSWESRPVLFNFGPVHGPSFQFSRRPLTGSPVAPWTPGVPRMTQRQAEALDAVHFTAASHQLAIQAERGDIILVNNLAILHARDAFMDSAKKQRHIMRMWLRNEELAWPTPDALQAIWTQNYSKDSPWHKSPVWHLEPPTVPKRLIFQKFLCS